MNAPDNPSECNLTEGTDSFGDIRALSRALVSTSSDENLGSYAWTDLNHALYLRDPRKTSEFDVTDVINRMKIAGVQNVPERDKYYLAKFRSLVSEYALQQENKSWRHLNKPGAFWSLIQINFSKFDQFDEMYLLFLGILEGKTWKIAAVACGPQV